MDDPNRHHLIRFDDDTPSLFQILVALEHRSGPDTHVSLFFGGTGYVANAFCVGDPVANITLRRATGRAGDKLLTNAVPTPLDRFEVWADTLEYLLLTLGDGDEGASERIWRSDRIVAEYGSPNALIKALASVVISQATLATRDTDETVEEYLERMKDALEDLHIKVWAQRPEDSP